MAEGTAWRVCFFGPLTLTGPGGIPKLRTRKTAQLLAQLAIQPGRPVSKDELATGLWGDSDPEAARQSLRMAVSNLRAVMGAEAIESDLDNVTANASVVTSDLAEFERFVSAEKYGSALSLVKAPLCPEVDDLRNHSTRIAEAVSLATVRLLDASLGEDWHEAALSALQVLAAFGCIEAVHLALMRLYIAKGMHGKAIQQFEALEKEMDDLWGEPPSPAAVALLDTIPTAEPRSGSKWPVLDGLIGRQSSLNSIMTAVDLHRVVTLVATGGAGKTTLARSIVRQRVSQGAASHFVDLTSATGADAALQLIQSAVGLPITGPNEAVAAITRQLKSTEALIVLDNCEQISGQFGETVDTLVAGTAGITFLATSRIPLGSKSECLVTVELMPVPPFGLDTATLRSVDSVALFELEACRNRPEFQVSAENGEAVAEICRLFEGLPLAITLAAARARTMSPQEILAKLKSGFKWLKSGDPDGQSRHASLESAVKWSLDLLTGDANELLKGLCLFQAPFDRSMARAMAGGIDADDTIDELVLASLVTADTTSAVTKFSPFQVVREVVVGDSSDLATYRYRHFRVFADRVREIVDDNSLKSPGRTREIAKFAEDLLRSLEYAADRPGMADEAAEVYLVAAKQLNPIMAPARLIAIGEKLMARQEELTDRSYALTMSAAYKLQGNTADQNVIRPKVAACLERVWADEFLRAEMQFKLGITCKSMGDYPEAEKQLVACLEYAEKAGDTRLSANALYNLALNCYCTLDKERSFEYIFRAEKMARLIDDEELLIRILFDTASTLAEIGKGEEALEMFDEAIGRSRAIDSIKLEGLCYWQRGDCLLNLNQDEDAVESFLMACQLVVAGGFDAGLKWIFMRFSEALQRTNRPELGAKWIAWGKATREAEGRSLAPYEVSNFDRISADLKHSMTRQKFERFTAEGSTSTWQNLLAETVAALGGPDSSAGPVVSV